MAKKKVLITVTAYPLPSRSYDELVCTAGVLEDCSWIRIYPVPFKFLRFRKYQWVELALQKPRRPDFRPESYSPVYVDLSDLKITNRLDTKNNWEERKKYCLKNVYTNIEKLIAESQKPLNRSLATFKPAKIIDFIIEDDEEIAKQKVKEKYFDTFVNKHDLYLFLGTTLNAHRRRWRNPFVIVGVFYPRMLFQVSLKL